MKRNTSGSRKINLLTSLSGQHLVALEPPGRLRATVPASRLTPSSEPLILPWGRVLSFPEGLGHHPPWSTRGFRLLRSLCLGDKGSTGGSDQDHRTSGDLRDTESTPHVFHVAILAQGWGWNLSKVTQQSLHNICCTLVPTFPSHSTKWNLTKCWGNLYRKQDSKKSKALF
jgi:hypothetical protein